MTLSGKLSHDVEVILICEVSVEIDDVLMFESVVDADLLGYLVLDVFFTYHLFVDDFQGADHLTLFVTWLRRKVH